LAGPEENHWGEQSSERLTPVNLDRTHDKHHATKVITPQSPLIENATRTNVLDFRAEVTDLCADFWEGL